MVILSNNVKNLVYKTAYQRSQIANDVCGKQRLACLIISHNQCCVLFDWYKLLSS